MGGQRALPGCIDIEIPVDQLVGIVKLIQANHSGPLMGKSDRLAKVSQMYKTLKSSRKVAIKMYQTDSNEYIRETLKRGQSKDDVRKERDI